MIDDRPSEPDEFEYFSNKRPDRVYISRLFEAFDWREPEQPEQLRILSKVFDSDETLEFAQLKGELVLRVTSGQRQEVKVVFCERTRDIRSITFQRFSQSGKPHRHGFTFQGQEIQGIYNLLRLIKYIDLQTADKTRLDDQVVNDWFVTEDEKRQYLLVNPDLVAEMARNHVTKEDVVAWAYRKKQVEIFGELLGDDDFFEAKAREWNIKGKEAVWQKFFEDNPWIFGYGLNYIFTTGLDSSTLEQVTTGHTFAQSGKRTDALLKTRGYISSLCFVEIKTHRTELLRPKAYRAECWAASDELVGSVAQIQKTIQKAVKGIQARTEMVDENGDPTGETVFLYQPKAYVVIGSLNEFIAPNGINEPKFSSFELFRRNILNPEIITFDELYERTRFIVQHGEIEEPSPVPTQETPFAGDEDWPPLPEDDIPF
jgi:hypothetical protein